MEGRECYEPMVQTSMRRGDGEEKTKRERKEERRKPLHCCSQLCDKRHVSNNTHVNFNDVERFIPLYISHDATVF